LNNDIKLFFCSNDFKLSKDIIEFLKKSKFESFHLNKISIIYEISKFMFL
jgi:hypothetical protein